MERFVTFLWARERRDCDERVQIWTKQLQERFPDWKIVLDCPGFRIVGLSPAPENILLCSMPQAEGLIVGALFRMNEELQGHTTSLEPPTLSRVFQTRGESLLSEHWGSYVAFFRPPRSDDIYILRDPCGSLACFRTSFGSVDVLCSLVDDIAELDGLRFTVNWDAVRAFLISNHIINSQTGLRELTEILPGQRMIWRPHGPSETAWIWNPVELASRPKRQSFKDACANFRAVAERCAAAWTHAGGNVLVRMSGGLDSSIVAGLVRRATASEVKGVHFVGQGYEAYELQLARKVADHLGISLVEQAFDGGALNFRKATKGPRIARPTKQILGSDAAEKLQDICDVNGSQSVVSGHGGDALFLQRSIASDAVVDYLLDQGLGPELARIAYDTAVLLETSVWQVGAEAASQFLGKKKWDPAAAVKEGRRTANLAFAAEVPVQLSTGSTTSVWLEEAQQLPPCKAEQLRNLVALKNYHSVRGHALTHRSTHPLVSRPLIELSLQTPTHLFSTGGIDRALERAAFADLVPAEVARRTNKGFVNHSVIASIVSDLSYIRDQVLNGRCMRNGLFDRAKVESLLSPEGLLEGKHLGAAMDLVTVEIWLAQWRGP